MQEPPAGAHLIEQRLADHSARPAAPIEQGGSGIDEVRVARHPVQPQQGQLQLGVAILRARVDAGSRPPVDRRGVVEAKCGSNDIEHREPEVEQRSPAGGLEQRRAGLDEVTGRVQLVFGQQVREAPGRNSVCTHVFR